MFLGPVGNFYPTNAVYNTGTTTNSAKTQISLVKGYPTTEAGWMKFDISSIPDGAIINSVEFHGFVNSTYSPRWNINPVTNDPVTATPGVLYNDIMAESSSGYYLYRSEASNYSTGWKVYTLGGNANANLQTALSQNWFAIGIMDRDASSTYYIGFDGWNEANKPYLAINYSYVPPYTWLKVNGSGTTSGTIPPGSSQQIEVSFYAGTMADGIYSANIKITSNDPDEPLTAIPCTLTIVNNHLVNLTILLESLYNSNGIMRKAQGETGDQFPGNTSDQIVVELHNALNYSTIEYSAENVNVAIGGTANLTVPGEHRGNYYITVKHRNSIETTTAGPVSFAGSSISYDFTTSASQAYGSNQQNFGGVYAFYGGDVNRDGAVDTGDMTPVDNDASNFATGYLDTDVNGDGTVDTGDITILDNNSFGFVGSITP